MGGGWRGGRARVIVLFSRARTRVRARADAREVEDFVIDGVMRRRGRIIFGRR